MMNDDYPEIDDGLFDGVPGLWGRVLQDIIDDLFKPPWSREYQTALRLLEHPANGPLPFIADALGIPLPLLVRKIRRYIDGAR
jgi:hypothetical protein